MLAILNRTRPVSVSSSPSRTFEDFESFAQPSPKVHAERRNYLMFQAGGGFEPN